MSPDATSARPSPGVRRIRWIPGTDQLLARCFCGREREFDDPVRLWDWLLAHPEDDGASAHEDHVARRSEGEHP